jgi:NADH:ubiquinone oxidoreductase subunit F (NADH-binding)
MNGQPSYPEQMFARRLARYRERARTKLPHQVELEACQRVNALVGPPLEGPEGLPWDLFDREVTFDEPTGCLVFAGPGGRVAVSRDRALEFALALVRAKREESCGECPFCRIGLRRMEGLLSGLGEGAAESETLVELAQQIARASLCVVGRSAARPVMVLKGGRP